MSNLGKLGFAQTPLETKQQLNQENPQIRPKWRTITKRSKEMLNCQIVLNHQNQVISPPLCAEKAWATRGKVQPLVSLPS